MDQTIGIQFEARGINKMVTDFKTIEDGVSRLSAKFHSIASSIGEIAGSVRAFSSAIGTFTTKTRGMTAAMGTRGRMAGMTPFAHAAWAMAGARRAPFTAPAVTPSASMRRATGMTPFMFQNWSSVSRQGQAPPSTGGGGRGGTAAIAGAAAAGGERGFLKRFMFGGPGSMMGAGFFMVRWIIYHQILKGIRNIITEVLVGGAREAVDTALIELSAIGFDKKQKAMAFQAGANFARQFPLFTTEGYIQAMSQIGSAMGIGDVGFGTLRRGTELAFMGGALSKMSPEEFAKLLATTLAATQKNAEFRGMSQTARMEKITAQVVKAIEISMAWGPDFASAFRHMLPGFQMMGWSLARSLAFAGSLKTVGFHPGQVGRFGRYLASQGLEPMAKMYVREAGVALPIKGTPEQKRYARAYNEALQMAAQKIVRDKLESNMDAVVVWYGKALKKWRAMGYTFKQLGEAERWGSLMVKLGEVYETIARDMEYQLKMAEIGEVEQRFKESMAAAGLMKKKIVANMSYFFQSLIDVPRALKIGEFFQATFGDIGSLRFLMQTYRAGKYKGNLAEDIAKGTGKLWNAWAEMWGVDAADLRADYIRYGMMGQGWKQTLTTMRIFLSELDNLLGQRGVYAPLQEAYKTLVTIDAEKIGAGVKSIAEFMGMTKIEIEKIKQDIILASSLLRKELPVTTFYDPHGRAPGAQTLEKVWEGIKRRHAETFQNESDVEAYREAQQWEPATRAAGLSTPLIQIWIGTREIKDFVAEMFQEMVESNGGAASGEFFYLK